jgi:hypothetical protein
MRRFVILLFVLFCIGCGASVPGREYFEGAILDLTVSRKVARVGELVSVEVEFDPFKTRIKDPFTNDFTDEYRPDETTIWILLPAGIEYVPGSSEFNSGDSTASYNKRDPDVVLNCEANTINLGRQAIVYDFPEGTSLPINFPRVRFTGSVSEPSGLVEVEVAVTEGIGRPCSLGTDFADQRRSIDLLP